MPSKSFSISSPDRSAAESDLDAEFGGVAPAPRRQHIKDEFLMAYEFVADAAGAKDEIEIEAEVRERVARKRGADTVVDWSRPTVHETFASLTGVS